MAHCSGGRHRNQLSTNRIERTGNNPTRFLIDRFGLSYHYELKPLHHVYELVPVKGRTTLKNSSSDHFTLSVGRGYLEAKDAPLSALIEVLELRSAGLFSIKPAFRAGTIKRCRGIPKTINSKESPRNRRKDSRLVTGAQTTVDAFVVDHIAQPTPRSMRFNAFCIQLCGAHSWSF